MKNELWHFYYSGVDIVDQNIQWRESALDKIICRECGNYLPSGDSCADLVVDQQIPMGADMFSTGHLSPVITSNKIYSKISEASSAHLNFGKIYLAKQHTPLSTHHALTGKQPWVTLNGDTPSYIDGRPAVNLQERVCTKCGARFGRGRGKKYIKKSDAEGLDISWTKFGGILIRESVTDLLSGMKLKNVRAEKIEAR